MTMDDENSPGAAAIPVLQSSAVALRTRPKLVEELKTAPLALLMTWKLPVSAADRMRRRTGSTEMFSLVISPNRSSGAPRTLVIGFRDWS